MTPMEMLREWHRATGGEPPLTPAPLGPDVAELRRALLTEELNEVTDQLRGSDLSGLAKELADLVYVAYGTAVAAGIDLDAVLHAVHASNMTKVGTDGRVEFRSDGKVLKGPNYRPPDVAHLLAHQASSANHGAA